LIESETERSHCTRKGPREKKRSFPKIEKKEKLRLIDETTAWTGRPSTEKVKDEGETSFCKRSYGGSNPPNEEAQSEKARKQRGNPEQQGCMRPRMKRKIPGGEG